jgi:glycine/D-amino acid oxidase-like deaminating enzyme/nitrite reductase/ring-hydroxylating ferredoxin subunit
MAESLHQHTSLWVATAPTTHFPTLQDMVTVDVAVLGGGIVGVTLALLLKRAGKRVALVESNRIVQGVTGYTTAKVTSGHNLIYAHLIDTFGEEAARVYAESNQAALERVARFVSDEGIACDFERKPNYCYGEAPEEQQQIEDEVAAAQRLGLPVQFVSETGLPFPVVGAIRYENQAQFHPRKYLLHLARLIPGDGSWIFEQTRALDVEEGSPSRVITDTGVILAEDVVVATHFPILDRGLFFARAYQQREYAICVRADASKDPGGMYITVGSPTRSVRTAPAEDGIRLIIGGEKHRPGEDPDNEERYRVLEDFARERFGVTTVEYRWSTQDVFSMDRLPYIGRLRPGAEHLYVATGFNAWGMTNGTLAAMIIADLILKVANVWAEFYDPNRLHLRASAPTMIKEGLNAARHLIGDRLTKRGASPSDIAPGEGEIVEISGKQLAVYKDEQGGLHAVSPVCTHMGCIVGWNSAEKSWDCPCHGSRFSTEGRVLHGPAVADLERKEMPGGEA